MRKTGRMNENHKNLINEHAFRKITNLFLVHGE
jgi:hypothetical protein